MGQYGPAVRVMVLFTVLLGIAYPLAITGVGQVAFHDRANGSRVEKSGTVVGSSLIGQSFAGSKRYFWGRPSAGGYDPLATGASNLALDSSGLRKQVAQRRAQAAKADGVAPSRVAADALYASGSGVDPQISPAYAEQQVRRVAAARGLSAATVRRLVAEHTQGRELGFLGEPRVNVLALNLALDASH
nr:potassium-transporting ATPase subunit KdpC [Nocardioides mangrovicus]